MKKRKKILLIVSIATTATLFCALVACSAYSFIDPFNTEAETVSSPTHAGEEEPTDSTSEAFADNSFESDHFSSENTESSQSDTVADESEDNTEEKAEEKVEELPSLEFTSLGNGTCAVTGIGNITASYVVIPQKSPDGEVVAEIAEKAFFSCDFIRAVEIPSTVSVIGDMAFADCSELVYIAVDKSNKMFIDVGGILFSSDMSRIIAFPSANGVSSINLPISVKTISPMAFYDCDNLKTITYEGTFEDWSKIAIGEMNYSLYTASIICKESK